MPWDLPAVPTFSGEAGIGELVATLREPSYLRMLGKVSGIGFGAGILVRRLPPQFAGPMALMAGIYIGLEMAAWMEEDAASRKGPVIDATAEAAVPLEVAEAAGYEIPVVTLEPAHKSHGVD